MNEIGEKKINSNRKVVYLHPLIYLVKSYLRIKLNVCIKGDRKRKSIMPFLYWFLLCCCFIFTFESNVM